MTEKVPELIVNKDHKPTCLPIFNNTSGDMLRGL